MRVLFAGDANIDLQLTGLSSPVQVDREVIADGFAATIGGSTTICAAAYSSLGGSSAFCGLLGDDHYGHLMETMLTTAGVDLSLLRFTSTCPTGVTVNLVHGATRSQVTFPGTLAIVDETDRIVANLGSFSHLHMGGLYPLQRFRPRITEVLAAARAAGVTTSITTQWDFSEQWEHINDWLPLLTYLFLNAEEASAITGKATVEEAWKALRAVTPYPFVTLGRDGVFAEGSQVPGFPVAVRDTTGAGDTFAAAVLYAIGAKGMKAPDAARYGCAAAALSCTHTGGVSPMLTDAAVKGLLG
ncbi:MAG TPA: carbohydrate kinase family protein [Spirochaetia bacterium]|nr:carbohydrate kinase family protein [Spirochaetia bacterium]